jgi:hypothetical protein
MVARRAAGDMPVICFQIGHSQLLGMAADCTDASEVGPHLVMSVAHMFTKP